MRSYHGGTAEEQLDSSPGRHCAEIDAAEAERNRFRIGKEGFFVLARKSRDCAEAYIGTPHKQSCRLTPPERKRTLSGRKLT